MGNNYQNKLDINNKKQINHVLYSPKSPKLQLFDENTDIQFNNTKNQINSNQFNSQPVEITNVQKQFNNDVDN